MSEQRHMSPIVVEVAKYARSGNVLMNLAKECHQRLEWGEAIKYMKMAMRKGDLDYPNEAQAFYSRLRMKLGLKAE